MRKSILCLALLLISLNSLSFAASSKSDISSLKKKLEKIIAPYKATIGIGIRSVEDGDTLTINNMHHYPMQSVFKFHLGLAVMHEVDKGTITVNQKVHISDTDLRPETRSPLRDKYPHGNIDMSVAELLDYSISLSDNNACDILFKLMNGTKPVEAFIHQVGTSNISIVANEYEMSKTWDTQYNNWTTPYAMADLLANFYKNKFLSSSSRNFLLKIMIHSENSDLRIKGLLPKGTVVAHKTGTSNINELKMRAAVNDEGIITLPNGKHLAVAVFVSDTMENMETNEKIIAKIAKAAYDYFAHKKNTSK